MGEKVNIGQVKSKPHLNLKSIKQIYCYLFYKHYRYFEVFSYKRPTYEIDASGAVGFFLLLLFLSLCFYSVAIIGYMPYIPEYLFLIGWTIFIASIFILNYRMFIRNKEWKHIMKYYSKLPKRTNQIGSVVVLLFDCTVFINMICSLYLMDQRLKVL